jgi:hypothetical protein
MSGLDTASRSGNTYDVSWEEQDPGNMLWYISMITVVAVHIFFYMAVVMSARAEDKEWRDAGSTYHEVKDEKIYNTRMLTLGGLFLVYALYSAVFPTQYVSYFAWVHSPLSSMLVAWFFNTMGQSCAALQLFQAVNLCIAQAYDENTQDRPDDLTFPVWATGLTSVYVCLVVAGALFALQGLISQNWLWFLVMTICRLVGCIIVLPVTVRLFSVAQMLRQKCGEPGCLSCSSWSAEPMAFVVTLFLTASIFWNALVEIPKSIDHLKYQTDALVPTLGFNTGFSEAWHRQTYTRDSSVWTPLCCISYLVTLGLSSTLAVLMSTAPRLGKHHGRWGRTEDSELVVGEPPRRVCTNCSIQ